MPSSRYLVRAHVVDSMGCHGADGNYTVASEYIIVSFALRSKRIQCWERWNLSFAKCLLLWKDASCQSLPSLLNFNSPKITNRCVQCKLATVIITRSVKREFESLERHWVHLPLTHTPNKWHSSSFSVPKKMSNDVSEHGSHETKVIIFQKLTWIPVKSVFDIHTFYRFEFYPKQQIEK